ncbi:MAG TPA: DNA polymerase III subunit gamma/tau [Pyrinomonadaceae bacterium]|nr:DNA polymerase III subunit gamma/tau [Pyrinomonadaceae bacterium]
MTYQVIARKWRPQTFEEVTGQEPITRTLRNAIEHERLHHAYLFSGARGVGKTTTARLLAKSLNCHKSSKPTPNPCRTDDPDACPSCREISESRSIDVQEMDAASHTQVENVRETILASVGFAPARDRFKIFIIDEVHMLSTHSFNALLKTIEEPPDRVVFIMATTEKHKVPDTILSRSQQFEFRTIAAPKILERLKQIAAAEKIKVDDQALREIARAGEGSMRDAQSAFDQVISFAGSTIKKEDVELALGVAGADILTRVMNGIAENTTAEAISVIDEVVMRGHDLRSFCRDLLAHFRDLLVTKVSGSEELLEAAVCEPAELKRQAALFSESDLVRFFHSLADTETKLSKAAHPRYQLEVGLVKLMEMRRLEPLTQLLERLSVLEQAVRGGEAAPIKSPSPTNSPQSPPVKRPPTETIRGPRAAGHSFAGTAAKPALANPQPSEAPPAFSGAQQTVTAAPEQSPAANTGGEIERIKAALEARRKMFLVTVLDAANSVTLAGNELCIEFAPEARYSRDTLAKSDNVKVLRDVCQEVTRNEIGVRIVIQDRELNNAPTSKEDEERREKQLLRESAERNPVVQQALRTFRGEIVDVRRVDPDQRNHTK